MPHEEAGTPTAEGEMSCESSPVRFLFDQRLYPFCLVAAWKHSFVSQCLSVVHDQAFGARPPSYKTLQELDKKVRSYYVPPSLQVPGFGGTKVGPDIDQPTTELTMQRYIAFAIKEISKTIILRHVVSR